MSDLVFVGDFRIIKKLSAKEKLSLKTLLGGERNIVANLEAPIIEGLNEKLAQKWAIIDQPLWVASELRDIGIINVGLANNHMMDYGHIGLECTIKTLNENRIKHFGAGGNIREALEPLVISLGKTNIKVGVFGLSCTSPPGSSASTMSPGIPTIAVQTDFYVDNFFLAENPGTPPVISTSIPWDSTEEIMEILNEFKDKVDISIAFIHWGVPYQHFLADYQIELGHKLIDSGFQAVVGHHSHTIQAIEVYKGKPIFYGLGHFMFTHRNKKYALKGARNPFPPNAGAWGPSPINLMVRVDMNKKSPEYHFSILSSNEEEIPKELSKTSLKAELSHLSKLSERFKTKFALEDDRRIKLIT